MTDTDRVHFTVLSLRGYNRSSVFSQIRMLLDLLVRQSIKGPIHKNYNFLRIGLLDLISKDGNGWFILNHFGL